MAKQVYGSISDAYEAVLEALCAGKPAVFPTDTVYGIGVSVIHASTPELLYCIKERDRGKPIAWLVGSYDDLSVYGSNVADYAYELARTYWPGALTLVVKASNNVPKSFCSAAGTIGLRMPAPSMALRLAQDLGSPLAVTSANIAGGSNPCSANKLDPVLLERVAAVAFDDSTLCGDPSAVIDATHAEPCILRPNALLHG